MNICMLNILRIYLVQRLSLIWLGYKIKVLDSDYNNCYVTI